LGVRRIRSLSQWLGSSNPAACHRSRVSIRVSAAMPSVTRVATSAPFFCGSPLALIAFGQAHLVE
jgi:hypothetical protein